ncbi:hypothetical protein CLU79DRAFT_431432 [Phycomyces nitens]|nr:hypothetical protein CLU79DRAFT_431432 [Phycomyces nitens]
MLAPSYFSSSILAPSIDFVSPSWTDHALLTTTVRFGCSPHGKGLYPANPLLVKNPDFVYSLHDVLSTLHPTLSLSPQENFELFKKTVIRTCKLFSGRHAPWRTKQLKKLQSKRNHFLGNSPPPAIRQLVLPTLERQIDALQEEIVQISCFFSGLSWCEQREKSAGYFKRTIATRASKRHISPIQYPVSHTLCTSPPDMTEATHSFYHSFFTPDTSDPDVTAQLLSPTTPYKRLTPLHQRSLIRPITLDDIQTNASRAPHPSSPGLDGLAYPRLSLVFSRPLYISLISKVYDAALTSSLFSSELATHLTH